MITKAGSKAVRQAAEGGARSRLRLLLPLLGLAALSTPRTRARAAINENNIDPNRPYVRNYSR